LVSVDFSFSTAALECKAAAIECGIFLSRVAWHGDHVCTVQFASVVFAVVVLACLPVASDVMGGGKQVVSVEHRVYMTWFKDGKTAYVMGRSSLSLQQAKLFTDSFKSVFLCDSVTHHSPLRCGRRRVPVRFEEFNTALCAGELDNLLPGKFAKAVRRPRMVVCGDSVAEHELCSTVASAGLCAPAPVHCVLSGTYDAVCAFLLLGSLGDVSKAVTKRAVGGVNIKVRNPSLAVLHGLASGDEDAVGKKVCAFLRLPSTILCPQFCESFLDVVVNDVCSRYRAGAVFVATLAADAGQRYVLFVVGVAYDCVPKIQVLQLSRVWSGTATNRSGPDFVRFTTNARRKAVYFTVAAFQRAKQTRMKAVATEVILIVLFALKQNNVALGVHILSFFIFMRF
jgi:hypothetical protein